MLLLLRPQPDRRAGDGVICGAEAQHGIGDPADAMVGFLRGYIAGGTHRAVLQWGESRGEGKRLERRG